ncbi:MAG: radical SAM protein, partial [Candidatus Omnitrophica bacterium]|nr:radical SAM protein [Candidatus Omnitrophota bacterium]
MKLIDNYIFGLKRKLLCCIEESCPALPLIVALTYGCNTVCSYCNAQGLKEKFEEEINVDDFKKVLSWMKRQRIKKIMFTGGEPTLHSRFKEIIELCREERIMCYMASHGYYAEAMNDFVGKNINVLFINCSTEYALKEKNDFTSKLCKLKEYGVKIILRINVNNSNDDLTWYLELAKTLNARVRIGITNP